MKPIRLNKRVCLSKLFFAAFFSVLLYANNSWSAGIVSVKTAKQVYVSSEPVYIIYSLQGLEAGYGINLGLSMEMPDGSITFVGPDTIFSSTNPIWLVQDWPYSPVSIQDGTWPLLIDPSIQLIPGEYSLIAEVYDAATQTLIARDISSFFLVNAPYIDHIEPNQGVTGDIISIQGEKFGSNPDIVKVLVGGREATIMEIEDSTIVAWVPYGSITGTVSVAVDGTISNEVDFLVGPYIEELSKSVLEPGDKLNIKGFNFDTDANRNYVYFNGIRGTVQKATATQLDVLVPDGNTGPLHVVVNEMKSNIHQATITPVVESLTPETGNADDTVVISGWNFNPVATNNYVVFNSGSSDEVAATILDASSTQLVVEVPAAETGDVAIYTDGQVAEGDVTFTFPPVTTEVTPQEIMAGDSITITGLNYDDIEQKNTVMVGSQTLTITSATAHEIKARTPVNLESGNIAVTVNGLSSMEALFLTVYPAPLLSSLTPASIATDDTSILQIEGVGFENGVKITLSGNSEDMSANNISVIDYNTLSFKLPTGITSGTYTVTATRYIAGRTLESNSLNLYVQ